MTRLSLNQILENLKYNAQLNTRDPDDDDEGASSKKSDQRNIAVHHLDWDDLDAYDSHKVSLLVTKKKKRTAQMTRFLGDRLNQQTLSSGRN